MYLISQKEKKGKEEGKKETGRVGLGQGKIESHVAFHDLSSSPFTHVPVFI